MTKLRVDEVQNRVIQPDVNPAEQVRRRRDLHATSNFERQKPTFAGIGKADLSALKKGSSAQQAEKAGDEAERPVLACTVNGQTVEVPCLSGAERGRLEALRSQLDAGKRAELHQASRALARALLRPSGDDGAVADAQQALDAAVTAASSALSGGDCEDAIVFSTMDSAEQDLRDFMQGVAGRADIGNEVRADVSELEGMLADWPDDGSTQKFSYREIVVNDDGTVSVIEHKNVELTKEQAEALLSQLQNQVDSMSSVSLKDQNNLQIVMHKYQQISDALSNMLKNVEDTRKNIIGNLKA